MADNYFCVAFLVLTQDLSVRLNPADFHTPMPLFLVGRF